MQILIEIPEEEYDNLQRYYEDLKKRKMLVLTLYEYAILNGTPLPKGHGKIIDADTIHIVDENFYTKSDYYEAIGAINDAPTIIEAVNREDFETVKEREV